MYIQDLSGHFNRLKFDTTQTQGTATYLSLRFTIFSLWNQTSKISLEIQIQPWLF